MVITYINVLEKSIDDRKARLQYFISYNPTADVDCDIWSMLVILPNVIKLCRNFFH